MSEVCVVNLNNPSFSRLQDAELHTQNGYRNSPISDTNRVLTVLRIRGYELWTTPNSNVWYAVKGEEQLAVLRQDTPGNDRWYLAGATGDVPVTPEEAALCLRINSDDRARFKREHPEFTDEQLQYYTNWQEYGSNEEELKAGVLSTHRSRHHFACYMMELLDRREVSEQEMRVGKGLERKLAIPARVTRI